jgi:hypothetical protein
MNPETPCPRQRERVRLFAPRVFDAARVEDVLAERTRAMAAGGVLAERTRKTQSNQNAILKVRRFSGALAAFPVRLSG